jgi:hypothetical protein
MVGRVTSFRVFFPGLLVLGLGCGGDNSSEFVVLDKLCSEYAHDVCSAQERCCHGDAGTEANCETRVEMACDTEQAQLVKESSLAYDGVHANDQLAAQRGQLDSCKPAFGLGQFFTGGKAKGASCARATECVDLVCTDQKCAAAASAEPLCQP